MHCFDNSNSVILSNGERKHELGFGETLGMWFSAKFDSFLPTLLLSVLIGVESIPQNQFASQLYIWRVASSPNKGSDGSRGRFLRWIGVAGSIQKDSAFPGHWMAFFPIIPPWEFLPSQSDTPWRTPWRNKSRMLLGYRKNIGLFILIPGFQRYSLAKDNNIYPQLVPLTGRDRSARILVSVTVSLPREECDLGLGRGKLNRL